MHVPDFPVESQLRRRGSGIRSEGCRKDGLGLADRGALGSDRRWAVVVICMGSRNVLQAVGVSEGNSGADPIDANTLS